MKRVIFTILVLAVAVFTYWAISPLFISIKIDEQVPVQTPAEETGPVAEQTTAGVVGSAGHPASGTARIVKADGKTYVRYENFKTINGPDLFVYLAKDTDARDFINLGTLKATEGNINYEVPAGVNIEEYSYVLTWCRALGVLFNYARIQ